MKIFIGADHNGIILMKQLKEYLESMNFKVELTTIQNNDTDDYPDFAFEIAQKVAQEQENLGILICGNGIGISIAANKVRNIRCARVTNDEDAKKAKNHNGANIIAFGGISFEEAKIIVDVFLQTPFPKEKRHIRRIQKIMDYELGKNK